MADQSEVVELLTTIIDELKDINTKLEAIESHTDNIDTTLLLKDSEG